MYGLKEGKIVNTPLERQMKTSYIDMPCRLCDRALLMYETVSPVHAVFVRDERSECCRIKHIKSARIVGDVLGSTTPRRHSGL
ncbi:MAG: hypothetical protein ACLUIQ_05330 [Dialister invisus]